MLHFIYSANYHGLGISKMFRGIATRAWPYLNPTLVSVNKISI